MNCVFNKSNGTSRISQMVFALVWMFAVAIPSHAQQSAEQSTFQSNESVGSVTEPQGNAYVSGQKFNAKWSRVTLYRPAQGFSTGAASISINGRFHTALQLGGYSEICLEPGSFELTAVMVQTGGELKNFKDDVATLKPQPAQDVYVRVFEYGDGRATLSVVREDVALPELKSARRQVHAVSRFAQSKACIAPEAMTAERGVEKENIAIAADALFLFDRSDIAGITDGGKEALASLVNRLHNQYRDEKNIAIHITGHADPLGSDIFNQRLSEARAASIRAYLLQSGLKAHPITIEGKGAEQPIIATCAKTATTESIRCNKPNRRVVVKVHQVAR